MLKRRRLEHPYAVPPFPGAQGLWLLRIGEAAPLGCVKRRAIHCGYVFDVYAHCRDDAAGRPWVRTATTFNSVAWAVQHDSEIRRLIARSTPEPDVWPPPQ